MQSLFVLFFLAVALLWWLAAIREILGRMTPGWVRRVERRHPELGRRCGDWLAHINDYHTILRSGMLLASGVITALAYAIISDRFPDWPLPAAIGLAVAITAVLFILIQYPSRILARNELPLLLLSMPVLRALRLTVFHPALSLLGSLDERPAVAGRTGEDKEHRPLAKDEIMSLLERGTPAGARPACGLDEESRRMIRGIFDLGETAVREIMTPRVDIIGLPLATPVAEARRLIAESGHSRIPVYQHSIDEIKGVLYAKDFLDEERARHATLAELAHPPLYVPETKTVSELLKVIRRDRRHFAVLIDEYGGTAGVVTLEDIVELIMGDIQDEYDTEEDREPTPKPLPDGGIVCAGRTLIDDVNELLHSRIPDNEDVDTIGGYVCGHLGRIPAAGEELHLNETGLLVKVLKADRRRIQELKITRGTPAR